MYAIINIIKMSSIIEKGQDIEHKCIAVYQNFEKDLCVIWKKI